MTSKRSSRFLTSQGSSEYSGGLGAQNRRHVGKSFFVRVIPTDFPDEISGFRPSDRALVTFGSYSEGGRIRLARNRRPAVSHDCVPFADLEFRALHAPPEECPALKLISAVR